MNKTKSKNKSNKLYVIGIALLFLLAGFVGTAGTLSYKYNLLPSHAARMLVRQGILEALAIPISFYDPSLTKETDIGPPMEKEFFRSNKVARLEQFVKDGSLAEGWQIAKITNEKIKEFRGGFAYQPAGEPVLAELRKAYRLDGVIQSARNEFESMVLLRNWARSQFKRSDYQPRLEHFNAFEILKRNYRNVKNEAYNPSQYRPCHFFPLFYSQILLSMGHQVRLVRISPPEDRGYDGHGMTEVWSNQFRKWITMDADLNLHYEKDGIPLNMLEVHNERYVNGPSTIKIVSTPQSSGDNLHLKPITLEEMIPYHSFIQIVDLRNDWLTNHYFRGHPKRSDQSSLEWVDKKLPPVFDFKPKTNDPDEFYWTLNQTEIWVKKDLKKKNMVPLAFKTVTPNYSRYEVWLDDSKLISTREPFFNWEPHPGRNKLLVRSVNKFGLPGIPSSVELIVGGPPSTTADPGKYR